MNDVFRLVIAACIIAFIFFTIGMVMGVETGFTECVDMGIKFLESEGVNVTLDDMKVEDAIGIYKFYIKEWF